VGEQSALKDINSIGKGGFTAPVIVMSKSQSLPAKPSTAM